MFEMLEQEAQRNELKEQFRRRHPAETRERIADLERATRATSTIARETVVGAA
jgi:ferritin-like metal-binding protein YciE